MKRSERLHCQAIIYLQYATIWGFLTIALAGLAYAYHGAIYGCAMITSLFAFRWFCDYKNKARLAKAQRNFEKSQDLKNDLLSL